MNDFQKLLTSDKLKRKNNNYMSILNLIWSLEANRTEVAEALNISKVAVGQKIEALIKWGLVEEKAQVVSGSRGRRPVSLALKRDLFHTIGISLYQNEVASVALVNAQSEIIEEITLENLSAQSMEKCDCIINNVESLIEKYDIPMSGIVGIGIALTGIINPVTGVVVSSSQFFKERNFNLVEYFRNRLKRPCHLINVAHLKAHLEHKWGDAQNMSSFLCFHSGFGLGMFLNGRLYRGHQFHAGETGLMQIDSNGEQAVDGRVGTLSETASFYKITAKIHKIIVGGGKTEVTKYLRGTTDKVRLSMIVSAIEDGDQVCAQMMAENFEVIGRAIVNLAYIFNPEAIFLPKWTSRCPAVSLDVVRRMMGYYGVGNWELKTDILSARCGNEDLARGAALLPMESIFGNESLSSGTPPQRSC